MNQQAIYGIIAAISDFICCLFLVGMGVLSGTTKPSYEKDGFVE
jgi:hypothetical protein